MAKWKCTKCKHLHPISRIWVLTRTMSNAFSSSNSKPMLVCLLQLKDSKQTTASLTSTKRYTIALPASPCPQCITLPCSQGVINPNKGNETDYFLTRGNFWCPNINCAASLAHTLNPSVSSLFTADVMDYSNASLTGYEVILQTRDELTLSHYDELCMTALSYWMSLVL